MLTSKHIVIFVAILLFAVIGGNRSHGSAIGDKNLRALEIGNKEHHVAKTRDKRSLEPVPREIQEEVYHCSIAGSSLPSLPTANNFLTFHINDTVIIANTPYKCTTSGWQGSKGLHPRRQKRFIFSLLIGIGAKLAAKALFGTAVASIVGTVSTAHTVYSIGKSVFGGRGRSRSSNLAPYFTYCPSVESPIYTLNKTANVTWDHPNGTDPEDGDLSPLLKSGSESGSEFPAGRHEISYRIQDSRGSRAYCRFSFEVDTCGNIPRGHGNEVQCSFTDDGQQSCKVTCKAGYTFLGTQLPDPEYVCGRSTNYEWSDQPPSCSAMKPPRSLESKTRLTYTDMPCDRKQEIETQLRHGAHEHYTCLRNQTCTMEVSVGDCKNETESLDVNVTLNFPLEELSDLGLEHLTPNSRTVPDDLRKLLEAVSELETTAENLHNMSISLDGVEHVPESSESDAGVICRKGEGSVDVVCVRCPAGTYSDESQCKLCIFDTYQDETGQESCKPCGHQRTTGIIGATEYADCIQADKISNKTNTLFANFRPHHLRSRARGPYRPIIRVPYKQFSPKTQRVQ